MRIYIDGRYENERYLIEIDGQKVWLTGRSFKFFCRLVWAKRDKNSGWIYKTDIEDGFNQARYIYRMKSEIKKQYNGWQPDGTWVWQIVENNKLGYYRLDVTKDHISINRDSLSKHPDHGVSSLFPIPDEVVAEEVEKLNKGVSNG